MGKLILLDSLLQEKQKWASPQVSEPPVSTSRTGGPRSGLTRTTRRLTWEQDGRPIPSEELPTLRESFSRRLVSRLSSLTLPSGNVSEFSSSRTERRSPPSSPMTAV